MMFSMARSKTDNYLRKHKPDYVFVLITGLLLLLGTITLYTISPALNQSTMLYRQLGYIFLAGISFMIAAKLPIGIWRKIHSPLLIIAILISLLPVISSAFGLSLGREVYGATRWINLGPFSFQPSEFLKFALIIYLAGWLSQRVRTNNIDSSRETLRPLLIITMVITLIIAVLMKDLGTMLTITAIIFSMMYVSGIKFQLLTKYVGLMALAGIIGTLTFPHRMARLLTFLNPSDDLDGAGYHINQALIAIGSGGWFGLGLGKSVSVFGYLPQAINDSIFAIVVEQFGFAGSLMILFLYGALAMRLIRVMERSPNDYMKLIVAGMFGWLVSHVFINIGAMIGIVPLTGITLPFLSLGGTSLIFIATGFGVVFNISRYTSLAYAKEDRFENMVSRRRNRRSHTPTLSPRIRS